MYKTTNAGMNWNIISDSAFLTNDVIIFNENNMIIHNFSLFSRDIKDYKCRS